MATNLLDKPTVNQETFTGSFKTWLFKLWAAMQNISGVSGSTTFSGNVVVSGTVSDAQTYSRNLLLYNNLFGV